MMIHPAMRASAVRAACRRSATGAGASAGALAGRQQERTATTAAAGPLCGGRSSSSVASTLPLVQQRHLLGRIESEIPPPSTTRHRGFASAVATTFADEEVFGRAVAAAAATEAAAAENVGEGSGAEEQAVEHKPKPRRRRLLRDRPAPITLVREKQSMLHLRNCCSAAAVFHPMHSSAYMCTVPKKVLSSCGWGHIPHPHIYHCSDSIFPVPL